jgi:predicted transcriptional regulator
MKTDLYSETMRLAEASGLSVAGLARATGLKERWLHRLLRGDFQDPGVRKIERLHTYLTEAHEQIVVDVAPKTMPSAAPKELHPDVFGTALGQASPASEGEAA